MPPRREAEQAGGGVKHAVEDREIEAGLVVGLEEIVELRHDLGRRHHHRRPAILPRAHEERGVGDAVGEEGADGHRQERRRYAVAADVDDEQPEMLVVEREDVEEVSGKFVAGDILPGNRRTGDVDRLCGEERLLHLRGSVEVARHPLVAAFDLLVDGGQIGVRFLERIPRY